MKAGLRILSATASTEDWHINFEVNAKRTVATVTADKKAKDSRKDIDMDESQQDANRLVKHVNFFLISLFHCMNKDEERLNWH